ncbi:hypothetical protein V2J09_016398 [Rumex salicifolius]
MDTEKQREEEMVDEQATVAGRRRTRGTGATDRAEALERLKALRRGERRNGSSYQIKLEKPIYDTVDEDEYNALVSRRRDEFSNFIVDDDDGAGAGNLGYRDFGEEEDWTQSGLPDFSDESDGGNPDRPRRKKPEKKEKSKDLQPKKPPHSSLSAAAALMGKQRISSMFTSSVFKKRGEDKSKSLLPSDSIVDDVIAEFAPDELDREMRRGQSRILGSGQRNSQRIENSVTVSHFQGNAGLEKKQVVYNRSSIGFGNAPNKIEENDLPEASLLGDSASKGDEDFLMVLEPNELTGSVAEMMPEEDGKAKMQYEVRTAPTKEEDKVNPGLKVKEEKVFSLNAKIEDEKVHSFSASAEMQAFRCSENQNHVKGEIGESVGADSVEKSEFELEPDGSLPFYILDAHEEIYGTNMGTIYLFGKVKVGNTYQSCCVVVKNMQRCVYAIPFSNTFYNEEVLKIEKDAADSKITPANFLTKLHDVASGLKNEITQHLLDLNISNFSMTPVKRSYAFERSDVPMGENYVLKINYPYKDPTLPSDLKGEHFSAVLGTKSSALELFLVKRKIKGPLWLFLSKFSLSSSHQRVSWCKFEVIVDCSKDIKVAAHTVEIPPVTVTAINLKTIINPKQNVHEIVSASIISCNKSKIDTPMLPSEWKRPGMLGHFTVIRKLEGGIYPIGFAKKVIDKNSEARSNVERALLNRLMIELYKLDSDFLVGHNISGFDLDILLHRAQACRVPSSMWSKLGRLKRSVMPKLSKGSNVFGSGASLGIMTCMAGRLLCDTFLCSRDLLKEVSYSLTQLAKTQLNKDRNEIAPHDIPNMFQTTDSLMELIECNKTDAWLSMELMFHMSILPLTRQLTNISGNLWGKTLQGARAQRVEYLLLHAFHAKKYIVPDKYSSYERETRLSKRKVDHGHDDIVEANVDDEARPDHNGKGKKGPAYAGGLVLEPKKGLYDKYILLLDFNSLYPSIIQEYNICFTTVERSSDGPVPHLPSSQSRGVLPELLKNLVERRRLVKSWMKNASGLKVQQLDIQQQALKLTANSMYGCLGFSNSRFYAKPLAELITSHGRDILQSTVDLVQKSLNLEVIYGDTDSIMIYSGLDDIAEAKATAGKVILEVNKKYRCLEIDLDGLYKRMLLLKKKKYAAVKVQFKDGTAYEVIEQKGLDMVRRDWSLLSKEIGDFCLSQILSGGSCEDVVESIHNSLRKIQEKMRNGEVALEKYVITKTLTKPPEAYPDAKNQPHVQIALRLKHNGYSSGCSAGDTVPYVVCCEEGGSSGTSAGIAQRARHPDELKRDNGKWMIDIDYYLSQQIHPVVSRLCACIEGTSPAHLADCLGLDSSKFQGKTSKTVPHDSSTLLSISADEERYQECKPLTFSCPSCSTSFESPSVFRSLCNALNNKGLDVPTDDDPITKFWQDLRCPKCPKEGDVGGIPPAMIANQVKWQADGFISMYYRGVMTCDDETCKYTTRAINFRVIGDSERGTICPNYPRCNGHLVRKYSEADLYRQLSYFCHLLDTTRCVEKVDVSLRIQFETELARVRPLVNLASTTAQKMRDRCAYGWIQLQDLF